VESALLIFETLKPQRQKLTAELTSLEISTVLSDTAVAILVDQSGSMKGERIRQVAATVRGLADCLIHAHAKVEVLGFSTAGWQGSFARRDWIAAGRPNRPGRLCALLHILYKSADEAEFNEGSWQAMLNPDLLRENVDGEAILWSVERLKARPERRKILLVFSDGAPVDDSTLMENGRFYLWRHVQKIICEVEESSEIELAGIGVQHPVGEIYSLSRQIDTLENLFPESGEFLCELLSR
jgi:cobaltochelatase CobT